VSGGLHPFAVGRPGEVPDTAKDPAHPCRQGIPNWANSTISAARGAQGRAKDNAVYPVFPQSAPGAALTFAGVACGRQKGNVARHDFGKEGIVDLGDEKADGPGPRTRRDCRGGPQLGAYGAVAILILSNVWPVGCTSGA
jgi:hypothetical protein